MAKIIYYGIIGGGVRAEALLKHLVKWNKQLILKGVCDPSEQRRNLFKSRYGTSQTICYTDFHTMLDDSDIHWVIVTSPNCHHKEHIACAFDKEKNVFAEKPLATSIDDCIAINNSYRKTTNLFFATGFVLRYSPLYQKVKELLDSDIIGKIISVEANENIPPEHSGHIMTNWRRHKKLSGSHILEKCCHDMDLLTWFIGSLPSRISSFGGLNIFTPQNKDNLTKLKTPPNTSSVYLAWDIPSRDTLDPFASEKDIVDNQVAILEYRNQTRVMFQTCLNNAIPERRMRFLGTEGNLITELYAGQIKVKRIGYNEPTEVYEFPSIGGHGGGDEIITEQLVSSMINQTPPACSGKEGLQSAVISLGLEEARIKGMVVNLEPVWQKIETN